MNPHAKTQYQERGRRSILAAGWVAFCALGLVRCSEPTVAVRFSIPETYRSSAQCKPNCDKLFSNCRDPGSDPEKCKELLDACMLQCNSGNNCEKDFCYQQYLVCLQPNAGNSCADLKQACYQSCQKGTVQYSKLQVFRPSSQNAFTCDQLAFGDPTPELLSASLTQEVVLQENDLGTTPPIEMQRSGVKILLAQGFDALSEPVVAACAEVDEIADDLVIDMPAEPAAVVRVLAGLGNIFQNTKGLPSAIDLSVSDSRSLPLGNVVVRWEAKGPGGTGSSGTSTSDARGALEIRPTAQLAPGPYLFEIKVRWQRGVRTSIYGFTQPTNIITQSLTAYKLRELEVGRIGESGAPGLAALQACANDPAAECLFRAYLDPKQGSGGAFGTSEISLPGNISTGNLIMTLVPAAGEDRISMVGPNDWQEFRPKNNQFVSIPANFVGAVPDVALTLPSCLQSMQPMVLIHFNDGRFEAYDTQGVRATGGAFANLVPVYASNWQTGCVSDQAGEIHRALAYITTSQVGSMGNWKIVLEINQTTYSFDLLAGGTTVGFSSSAGSDNPLLYLGSLGVEGAQLSSNSFWLLPSNDTLTLTLDEVSQVPLLFLPESIQTGDLDGDKWIDVVSIFPYNSPDGSGSEYFAQVVMGASQQDKRMLGIFSLGPTTQAPRLWMTDLNNDGKDDWLVLRLIQCIDCKSACEAQCKDNPDQECYNNCTRQCENKPAENCQFELTAYMMSN